MCLHPGAIRAGIWRPIGRPGWIMIRSSAAFLLALPVAVAFTAAPVLAQYAPPPPGAYYRERLPPAIGSYDDDEDLPPPPRNLRRGQQGVLPYPDDEPPLPPPGLYGAPDQRSYGYGQQPYQQQPQQPPPMQGAPSRGMSDPNSLRPPAAIGAAHARRAAVTDRGPSARLSAGNRSGQGTSAESEKAAG